MANTEIPTSRQAVRAWKRLDADVRNDVWRRARQGMGYPDPAVAATAVGRARYALSPRAFLRYWGLYFVVITGAAVGLLAALDRVTRLGPIPYIVVITMSFGHGVTGYTRVRQDAKRMEEANIHTLKTGHTGPESSD